MTLFPSVVPVREISYERRLIALLLWLLTKGPTRYGELLFSKHDKTTIPVSQLTHVRPCNLLESVPAVEAVQTGQADEPGGGTVPVHPLDPMQKQPASQAAALELGLDAQGGEVPGIAATVRVHDGGLDVSEDAGEGLGGVGVDVRDREQPVSEIEKREDGTGEPAVCGVRKETGEGNPSVAEDGQRGMGGGGGHTGAEPALVEGDLAGRPLPPREPHGGAGHIGGSLGGDADGQDVLEGPPAVDEEAVEVGGERLRVAGAAREEDLEQLLAAECGQVEIAGPGHVCTAPGPDGVQLGGHGTVSGWDGDGVFWRIGLQPRGFKYGGEAMATGGGLPGPVDGE